MCYPRGREGWLSFLRVFFCTLGRSFIDLREGKEIYLKVLSNSTIMKKCASVRFVTSPFVLCERDFVSTFM